MSYMTEEAILTGCLRNDATAQKELYNRYSPKMLSVCFRYAHNREDAEDMLQEGFIKVFSQIHTFQGKKSDCAYLHQHSEEEQEVQ